MTYNINDFSPQTDAEISTDGIVVYHENLDGTLLSSGARTANTNSPQQKNYKAKGVMVYLDVTTASGTGGLHVRVRAYDPVSGKTVYLNSNPTAITAIGTYGYLFYPTNSQQNVAASNNINQSVSVILPRVWDVFVVHDDTSSYTYSVGYSLIL